MAEPLFELAGVPFTRFGCGCALAVLICLIALYVFSRGRKADYAGFLVCAVMLVPLGWLLARLVYVAVDFIGAPFDGSLYLNRYADPSMALRFWEGGYSLMGGLFGALLAARLAERLMRTEKAAFRDALALALPLAIAVERIAEFGTGLGEGREVTAEWLLNTGLCIENGGAYYFPVCLLEALTALVLFAVMLIRRLRGSDENAGDALRTFLTLFGLTQVVLESLRHDGHMEVHFVYAQQVIAIIIVVVCIAIWAVRMHGDTRMEAVCWTITFACIGLAVWAEFGVDRWGLPLLAYGLMIACMVAIGWVAFALRDWSGTPKNKKGRYTGLQGGAWNRRK